MHLNLMLPSSSRRLRNFRRGVGQSSRFRNLIAAADWTGLWLSLGYGFAALWLGVSQPSCSAADGPCWLAGIELSPTNGASVSSDQETPAAGEQPRATVDDHGWRFTLRAPAADWYQPNFDDREWSEGQGGFGTVGTPGSRIGTEWNSPDIWLRRRSVWQAVPARPALWIHHDEDAQVFLNGVEVARLSGYTTGYQLILLEGDARAALRAGENVLALTCHQTAGGQYIDAHLVDADNMPQMLPIQRRDLPFKSALITPWGESLSKSVDEVIPWSEYPRPAFQRSDWTNLNGKWKYAITDSSQTEAPGEWNGDILVPFALESKLSGVQRLLKPSQSLWYRRSFELSPPESARTLLHFEAVDYECWVYLNGEKLGHHRGGHTPFSFDVTTAIHPGVNEVTVRVLDHTEGMQLRGKQVLDPNGIWYTQVSGIWQTVWMEQVPESYFSTVKTETDANTGVVRFKPELGGSAVPGMRWEVRIVEQGQDVAIGQAKASEGIELTVPEAKLWSPASPHLYDVHYRLLDANGSVVDQVSSYVGIRSIAKVRDSEGRWQLTLNGQPIFHWGPLDQGWWPDGLLTPPSDAALRFDVDYLKAAGFNMIRKHIKVEPRRFYEYCDRIGMMVWQDQVSGGTSPAWTRLAPSPEDANWSDQDHQQYMLELDRMITHLENHPSVVMWVPFNEAWGQHRTVAVGEWTRERDASRLVNIASGGNFWPVGDVVDHHEYPHPGFPFDAQRDREFVMVVGEFGGHGLPIRGHLWNPEMDNWGYGGLPKNAEEYLERYEESLRRLRELRERGIAAGVYTQTTDVEGEINGLMTYDRRVIKIPAQQLRALHVKYGFSAPITER